MKVHPVPRKHNIALRYDVTSVLALANSCRQKKLRRLPHIYEKVLELPFHPDADVSIDETSEALRFVAATDDIIGDIRADAVEICPGVTKIVIRGNGVVDLSGTELEIDLWRFRLPASTRMELASASYDSGELVVTVPKGAEDEEEDGGGDIGGVTIFETYGRVEQKITIHQDSSFANNSVIDSVEMVKRGMNLLKIVHR